MLVTAVLSRVGIAVLFTICLLTNRLSYAEFFFLSSGIDDALQKRESSVGISFGSVIYHSRVLNSENFKNV